MVRMLAGLLCLIAGLWHIILGVGRLVYLFPGTGWFGGLVPVGGYAVFLLCEVGEVTLIEDVAVSGATTEEDIHKAYVPYCYH